MSFVGTFPETYPQTIHERGAVYRASFLYKSFRQITDIDTVLGLCVLGRNIATIYLFDIGDQYITVKRQRALQDRAIGKDIVKSTIISTIIGKADGICG